MASFRSIVSPLATEIWQKVMPLRSLSKKRSRVGGSTSPMFWQSASRPTRVMRLAIFGSHLSARLRSTHQSGHQRAVRGPSEGPLEGDQRAISRDPRRPQMGIAGRSTALVAVMRLGSSIDQVRDQPREVRDGLLDGNQWQSSALTERGVRWPFRWSGRRAREAAWRPRIRRTPSAVLSG